MTVPAVPSDMSAGNVWTAARVNTIYDHLEWHRDTAPLFIAQLEMSNESQSAASGVTTEVEWSNGSGSFNITPIANIGSFTAGTGGEHGIYLPESGFYRMTMHIQWSSEDTDGYRLIQGLQEGTAHQRARSTVGATTVQTRQGFTCTIDGTAGDEIGTEVLQNSGSTLPQSQSQWVSIELEWIRST